MQQTGNAASLNAAMLTTDVGGFRYPEYGSGLSCGTAYPMELLNGREFSKRNRQAPQSDVDMYPYPIRRYTNMSVTDVQLGNGLRNRVASGLRIPYPGAGYLNVVRPQIPGQTRDNVAGYHKKGPSPYRVQDVWTNGPGSQPEHPGGPGKIAASAFINPMSG